MVVWKFREPAEKVALLFAIALTRIRLQPFNGLADEGLDELAAQAVQEMLVVCDEVLVHTEADLVALAYNPFVAILRSGMMEGVDGFVNQRQALSDFTE